MARVRLGLGKLSITDKIARGRHIVARLTNNASFPNPHPPLTEVTTALDELEAASAQVQSANPKSPRASAPRIIRRGRSIRFWLDSVVTWKALPAPTTR
jgi:hypothetical protein